MNGTITGEHAVIHSISIRHKAVLVAEIVVLLAIFGVGLISFAALAHRRAEPTCVEAK